MITRSPNLDASDLGVTTDGAVDLPALFERVARATGASIEDIGALAATLTTNLRIPEHDLESAFEILITTRTAS